MARCLPIASLLRSRPSPPLAAAAPAGAGGGVGVGALRPQGEGPAAPSPEPAASAGALSGCCWMTCRLQCRLLIGLAGSWPAAAAGALSVPLLLPVRLVGCRTAAGAAAGSGVAAAPAGDGAGASKSSPSPSVGPCDCLHMPQNDPLTMQPPNPHWQLLLPAGNADSNRRRGSRWFKTVPLDAAAPPLPPPAAAATANDGSCCPSVMAVSASLQLLSAGSPSGCILTIRPVSSSLRVCTFHNRSDCCCCRCCCCCASSGDPVRRGKLASARVLGVLELSPVPRLLLLMCQPPPWPLA